MSGCQLENSRKSFNKHGVCACYGVAPPKLEVFAGVVYNMTSLHEYATLSFDHDGVQVHF